LREAAITTYFGRLVLQWVGGKPNKHSLVVFTTLASTAIDKRHTDADGNGEF
jgi:hypothetical protein